MKIFIALVLGWSAGEILSILQERVAHGLPIPWYLALLSLFTFAYTGVALACLMSDNRNRPI